MIHSLKAKFVGNDRVDFVLVTHHKGYTVEAEVQQEVELIKGSPMDSSDEAVVTAAMEALGINAADVVV